MATNPDLPPPITPDLPDPPEPADLPVEPDQGVTARTKSRFVHWSLHLKAHRQFMGAAAYRWPSTRIHAWLF